MKNILLILIWMLATMELSAASENFTTDLVNYTDCKAALEGDIPSPGLGASASDLPSYEKAKTCNIWALASLISLESAKALCADATYGNMQKAISRAYSELPSMSVSSVN